MNQPVVELKDICVTFNDNQILTDVNLEVFSNDFVGIIGPNGGGKTTLLRIILGLIKPCSGDVKILGKSPEGSQNHIGYVPQNMNFERDFPISVLDVVLMGRLPYRGIFKAFRNEDRGKAQEALESVGMGDKKNRSFGRLSQGQKQRVLIARALVTEPKVLLMDEPTASIDTPMQAGIYELLRELNKKMAIILVSHDIGVISTHVNKIGCLNVHFYYHDSKEIKESDFQKVYGECSVELIAHGVPHRVLKEHKH